MLPIYISKNSVFNYDEIPSGYYFKVMQNGAASQQFWHKRKFNAIMKYLKKDESILDFGCGPGAFLYLVNEAKISSDLMGVDIASSQLDFAKENMLNSTVKFQGINLADAESNKELHNLINRQFDVITLIEVIEHIHPYVVTKIIEDLKLLLKPNGRIIISTPNYRSLWPIIEILLNKLSPVKYHDQHINKYTPNSLVKFVETCGLKVKSLSSVFVISPFLAGISWKLAKWVQKIEIKFFHLSGNILIIETEKEF